MTRIAAYLGVATFSAMALFQLHLALGMPFGHLAWGGDFNSFQPDSGWEA